MRSLLLTLLLLTVWLAAAGAASIEGRVVQDDAPVAGIRVMAYADADLRRAPLAVAAPSDADGLYRLELPPGSYTLAGWDDSRSRFALCGRNPVILTGQGEPLWVGLQLVPVRATSVTGYEDEYSAALEGRVLADDRPVSGAYVYLYLDAAEDLKGQGYRMSLPTGADGYFRFDGLPESDYYLAARKRQDGARVGPVRESDLFGLFPGNPLTAKAGELRRVEISVVGKQKDDRASERFGRLGGPVLTGMVTDRAGQPVAGLHVFAYTDRVIGHQRPAALSPPTAADGRFAVHLPAPGTYYVGARQEYGDSPAPGELFGMYDESADHGLTVAAGEVRDDLRIAVEPVALH
ncbi:MAG: carboxypeptidase-like regulatory domain-containing protein [Desulfuromonadales bacterium]|nr:carboxypeptidase-like regulatory domain-containing protein [Desulfuromonadales bacterium]